MVRTVRRDEQDGVIFPREIDPETKQDLYDFGLLSSGGSRQFDTNGIISRYEQRILMTVLADFILVGHENVGSYALHTDKSGLFRSAINSIAESIADVLNRYAVPRLFEVNGWKLDDLPTIEPSDVDPPDLTQLGQFMTSMSSAGVQWFPDPELEKFLRQAARLPELDEDQLMVRETEEKQSFIQRLATQRLEMINLQAQAQGAATQMASGQMGLQQQQQGLDQGQQQLDNPQDNAAQQQQALAQGDEKHKIAMTAAQQKIAHGDAANKQKLTHTEQMHQLRLSAAKKVASRPQTPASGKKPLPKPPAKGVKK
jgi:hypothetical protein